MKTLVKGFSLVALLSHMNVSYAANMLYGETAIATINQQRPGVYKVQTGVYANHHNAAKELERLKRRYNYPVSITQAHSGKLFIVTVGPINIGQESAVASQVKQRPSDSGMSLGVMGNPIGPWTPRINGQAWLGNQQGAGYIDSMIPVAGTNHFLWYVDGVYGQGVNKRMLASVGSGVRKLVSNQSNEVILGAFVFGDYTKSINSTQAWLINPGIEALTSHYEARLQASIPASHREQVYQATMASEIPSAVLADSGQSLEAYAKAVGHTVTDTPVALTQEYGRGVEAQVGKYFDFMQGTWLRAGVYYYDYKRAKSITGFEANLEVYTNRNVSLLIKDNYDSQKKNNAAIGFRILMGGPNNREVEQLANRMEEPVNRHIARDTFGEAIPTRQSFIQTGPSQTLSNVWFFSPEGEAPAGNTTTLANCTAENPCSNLDQATVTAINAIEPNANFFFNTGTYNIIQGQPLLPQDKWLNLYSGQRFWGRTNNFIQVATGDNRPLINGGLFWGDYSDVNRKNATGTIYNMQINNQNQTIPNSVGQFFNTIYGVGATGSMAVYDSNVIARGSSNFSNIDTIGVGALNGPVTIINSNVTADANATLKYATAYGIYSETDSASAVNSRVIVNTISGDKARAYGVVSTKDASTKNSYIETNANAVGAEGAESVGIWSFDENAVATNSTVISLGTANVAGYGADVAAVVSSVGLASAINSKVTSISNTVSGFSEAYGISSEGISVATNSTITVIANSSIGEVYTIGVYGYSGAIVDNTSVNASSITSGVADANAFGVSTWNNFGVASANNSKIVVNAETQGTVQEITGVYSRLGEAYSTNTSISINAKAPTIEAYGVFAANGGKVINSPITVNANGTTVTSDKCNGVTSPDGSCS